MAAIARNDEEGQQEEDELRRTLLEDHRPLVEAASLANIGGGVDGSTPSLSGPFAAFEDSMGALGLCALYFVSYVLLAIVMYSFVLEEHSWTIVDSMYFAIVTFTTVGYGDLTPSTDTARLFTICFALFGIGILGIFLGIVGHDLGELQSKALQNMQKQSTNQVLQDFVATTTRTETTQDEPPSPLEMDQNSTGSDSKPPSNHDNNNNSQKPMLLEIVSVLVSPLLLILVVCSLVLGYCKGWTVARSLYFCFMSLTTVGYGDVTPETQLDRALAIVLLPVSVAVFGEILGQIAGIYIRRKNQAAERRFLHRSFTLCDMVAMDTDRDQAVSREEFLTFMLVALGKVDRESIDQIMEVFQRLDLDNSGEISKENLAALQAREHKKCTMRASGATTKTTV